jgi:hypothetical protein
VPDDATIENRPSWRPRKKRGPGKPPPDIIFSGANIVSDPKPAKPKVVFTQELADKICDLRAEGRSLRWICLQEGMPGRDTFRLWRNERPELAAQYARACDDGDDAAIEERLDRLRDPNLRPEDVQRERCAFDGVKWYVSKTQARKYGDRLDVRQEISGSVQLDVLLHAQLSKPEILARLSEAQIEALMAAIPLLVAPAAGSEPPVDAEFTEVKEKEN